MSKLKTNSKTIDLSVWKTQQNYAIENKVSLGTVSQWVMRTKAGIKTPIEITTIEELKITLVRKKASS